ELVLLLARRLEPLQQIARLVLAAAGLERAADGADEGIPWHRRLQRDQGAGGGQALQDLMAGQTVWAQNDERQVRPGRLFFQDEAQFMEEGISQRFFGREQDSAATDLDLPAERFQLG